MRIIMIGQKGLPAREGGVERHVEDLATRLTREGHEVIAYCRASYAPSQTIPSSYLGVRLIRVPAIPTKHLETMTQTFLASIHALFCAADIIHYHGIGPSLFAWIPRLLAPRVRVIATFHCQDYYHQKWGVFARLVFRIGEVVACTMTHSTIAVSKTIQEYIKKTYGRDAAYLPNAVALGKRMPADRMKSYGLEKGKYLLLVSRMVRHKNIHFVIQGYQRLTRAHVVLPKLVIVGSSCHTDEYVKEVKELASGNQNILFLGEQDTAFLAELYSNARLFVHASASEGLSYALLEAMSYGCPVLVSDIAENKEVLHAVGTTFKTNDLKDFMVRLNETLQTVFDAALSQSEYTDTIRTHYHSEDIFKQVVAHYEQMKPTTVN